MPNLRYTLIRWLKGSPIEKFGAHVDELIWMWRGTRRGSYSQHGEDRLLLEYFNGRKGTYVDVGANYPVKISNTYLLYRNGWTGLTVEPIPRLSQRHCRFRPRDAHVNAGVGPQSGHMTFWEFENTGLSTFDPQRKAEAMAAGGVVRKTYEVPVEPLSKLIREHLAGREVDLLSVDTEGYDYQVLQTYDWSGPRPRVVLYEVAENGEADEVGPFLARRGYRAWRRVGCNVIVERIDG